MLRVKQSRGNTPAVPAARQPVVDWLRLPNELWMKIIDSLGVSAYACPPRVSSQLLPSERWVKFTENVVDRRDIYKLSQTCIRLQQLVAEHPVWKYWQLNIFPHSPNLNLDLNVYTTGLLNRDFREMLKTFGHKCEMLSLQAYYGEQPLAPTVFSAIKQFANDCGRLKLVMLELGYNKSAGKVPAPNCTLRPILEIFQRAKEIQELKVHSWPSWPSFVDGEINFNIRPAKRTRAPWSVDCLDLLGPDRNQAAAVPITKAEVVMALCNFCNVRILRVHAYVVDDGFLRLLVQGQSRLTELCLLVCADGVTMKSHTPATELAWNNLTAFCPNLVVKLTVVVGFDQNAWLSFDYTARIQRHFARQCVPLTQIIHKKFNVGTADIYFPFIHSMLSSDIPSLKVITVEVGEEEGDVSFEKLRSAWFTFVEKELAVLKHGLRFTLLREKLPSKGEN